MWTQTDVRTTNRQMGGQADEQTQARTLINHDDNGNQRETTQVSNIIRTLVGNKIVDHSDVVGASPVGAAPTTSSLST